MAVMTPITVPLVANTESLVEACHSMFEENGTCDHRDGSIVSVRACEMMAQLILDKGGFQTSAEMIDALKDNSDVQGIIVTAMATAWDEGHDSSCMEFMCKHRNPYDGTTS